MAGKGTDLVKVQAYAAMQQDTQQLLETIKANLGGQRISEFDLDRVTIPAGGGKAWTVPTLMGDEVQTELQGVIVFWKDTRVFWQHSFDQQGGGVPPDCSSPDAETATGDPHAETPTDDRGRFICSACPQAVFGSDPREGSNAQACKLVRQLFLLTPEDLLPIVVSLPPTSVQVATKYFLRLSRAGVPFYSVVSRIGLEGAQSQGGIKYSKATFSLDQRLEGAEANRIKEYADALAPTFARATVQDAAEFGGEAD